MSYPVKRYPLDPTGESPNNFVSGEEHILGPKAGPYHPIAPLYGPFYNDLDSLRIYVNGVALLAPGVDYWCTNLISDETAKFSKEVSEIIIVKGRNEGDVITIDYQNVGGDMQNHSKGLVTLYDAFLKDNRPIDWSKGLKGKPETYPPAYHLHLLSDVVGWEHMIVAIERLINVLTLRNVPAFEALIDWVQARTLEVVTEEEILALSHVSKIVTAQRLLFASKKINFNGIRINPRQIKRGINEHFVLDIKSTNFDDGEPLFWNIRHRNSFPHMFSKTSGVLRIVGNEGVIVINSSTNPGNKGVYEFVVEIRRNSFEGPAIAESRVLFLVLSNEWDFDYGLLNNGVWSTPSTCQTPLVQPSAESMFLIIDDYFYEVSNA